jgi:catechol 2,3-dioxygenase-like lactoylglutathione lyase family enzyme
MSAARVRYMVNELDPAVEFYSKHLGFEVKMQAKPHFAMLSRDHLELILSTPFGPGGAAKPMLDGRKAEPGGWNRIIIDVDDLQAEVARLKQAHLHFRNDIAKGPGGSEIIVDDPSGNPVELFQPAARETSTWIQAKRPTLRASASSTGVQLYFTISVPRIHGCGRHVYG